MYKAAVKKRIDTFKVNIIKMFTKADSFVSTIKSDFIHISSLLAHALSERLQQSILHIYQSESVKVHLFY